MIAFASPIRTFSKAYAVVVYVFSFRISVVTVPVDPSNKLLLFFLQEELFQFKFLHLRYFQKSILVRNTDLFFIGVTSISTHQFIEPRVYLNIAKICLLVAVGVQVALV